MRALILSVLGLSTAGCMGVYAEANATVYPSIKYTGDEGATITPKPLKEDGGGFALGFSVGFDFDGRRNSRFALGYSRQSMSIPGGGSVDASQGELRTDIQLVRTGKSSRLRLGAGFGLGNAKVKMPADGGTEVVDTRGNGQVFGGPVFVQYFGKRHELSVMGAVNYFSAGIPGGGALRATGLGARVTYSFHFGDTRPSTTAYTPLDSEKNLLDVIDVGAKRIGCQSRYVERRSETGSGGYGLTATAVFATCPPDAEEIFFLQTVDGIMVECPHLDDDECRELTGRIIDSAKGVVRDKPTPPQPVSTPAPAPVAPPPPPVPGAGGASLPPVTGKAPTS